MQLQMILPRIFCNKIIFPHSIHSYFANCLLVILYYVLCKTFFPDQNEEIKMMVNNPTSDQTKYMIYLGNLYNLY